MGLVTSLVREQARYAAEEAVRPSDGDDYWYSQGAGSAAGMRVTPDTALGVPAVYACVRVLAETVAQLPLEIYRRRKDGGKDRATDHPLYPVIHSQPNEEQTSFNFREMMQAHLGLRGNAYAFIVPGQRRAVDQLRPIHPDAVIPERDRGTRKRIYKITQPDGMQKTFGPEEIFHIPGIGFDGIKGMNPIEVQRTAVGLSLAEQDYGASFFRNNAQPSVVITAPEGFKDLEAEAASKESWRRAHGGGNRGGTAILKGGLDIKTIGMTHRDAQFVDEQKFQAIQIARIFRMQPHKIGILDRATYSNIEMQSIEFVIDTMLPWLCRWEQAINMQLLTGNDTYFVEFNVDGLLRGDIKSRYEAYAIGIQNEFISKNEVRKRENMNPVAGGEELRNPITSPSAADMPLLIRALAAISEARAMNGTHKTDGVPA